MDGGDDLGNCHNDAQLTVDDVNDCDNGGYNNDNDASNMSTITAMTFPTVNDGNDGDRLD